MRYFLLIEIGLGLTLVAFCIAVITSASETTPPSRTSTLSRSEAASVPSTRVEEGRRVLTP